MQKVTPLPVISRMNAGERAKAAIKPKVSRHTPSVNGGQWTRGQSGNPNGRPIGSRNLTFRHLHELMMAQGEAVVNAVLTAAIAGDSTAMKLVVDRVLPRRVCNPISDVAIPPLRTAADASRALGEIVAAALDGRIGAADAAALAQVVEVFRKTVEIVDHERRIVELEARPRAQQ
jgi:Family of unknown function (DUF5681)